MNSTSLAGLAIVNTRAAHQAAVLTTALASHGAAVLLYPTIDIVPPADCSALDYALEQAQQGKFDWIVLTSTNTVEILSKRLLHLGCADGLRAGQVGVAAIGKVTAAATARLLGVPATLVPEEFVAESLAASLALLPGQQVFLPQSAIARPFLAHAFVAAGAIVTQLVAYHTTTGRGGDPVPQLFWEGRIDAVTFTSPSTVHNFLKRLKAEGGNAGMLVDVVVACIGPQTGDAAHRHDLNVQVLPEDHTIGGLVGALAAYFSG